jgi:hypothetical protein
VHYAFILVHFFIVVTFNVLNFNCLNNGMRFALIEVCLGMGFEELNGGEGCLIF